MILAERTARGWGFLVVWTDRPSVWFDSLTAAETAYHRSNLS